MKELNRDLELINSQIECNKSTMEHHKKVGQQIQSIILLIYIISIISLLGCFILWLK